MYRDIRYTHNNNEECNIVVDDTNIQESLDNDYQLVDDDPEGKKDEPTTGSICADRK